MTVDAPPLDTPPPTRPLSPDPDQRSRLLLAILIFVAGVTALFVLVAPVTNPLNPLNQPAVILVSADGQTLAKRGAYKDEPVEAEKLPAYVPLAFIAIEDRRFVEHNGVDLGGVVRAMLANMRAGHVVQGGSTITQQLAKTAYLDTKRTFGRKAKEALIAGWLELRMSKAQILSAYLSSVYFGDGVYGLRAASQHYFGKKPEELKLGEAALLAGLVKAPSKLNPTEHPAAAGRRARLVLDAMAAQRFISRAQARRAGHVRIVLQAAEPPAGAYFTDWVTPTALAQARSSFGAVKVQTTLDTRMQKLAERIIRRMLPRQGARQAALVAMTPDGAVRAMVGGRSYGVSQFNRATRAQRQPGSAFKLFVYDAAMRAGHRPDEMIDDAPITIGKWSPSNFAGHYSGPISLRQAFAHSSNVASVRLTQELGPRQVAASAKRLGIVSPVGDDMSIALGSSEVNLLELTAAYATVAGGRGPVRPYGVLADRPRSLGAPMSQAERMNMLQLLAGVVQGGTGRGAALKVATFGKTGTAQDSRDAWFIGFVDNLVVGVWVGNDDHSPTRGIVGGGLPAQIWRAFMTGAGYPGAPVPPPSVIESEGETLGVPAEASAAETATPDMDEESELVPPDAGGEPVLVVPQQPPEPYDEPDYGPEEPAAPPPELPRGPSDGEPQD